MFSYAVICDISSVTAIVGVILIFISNFMYFARSKEKPFRKFWLEKEVLSKSEYLLNRTGFYIALASIALLLVLLVVLIIRND